MKLQSKLMAKGKYYRIKFVNSDLLRYHLDGGNRRVLIELEPRWPKNCLLLYMKKATLEVKVG